eukprot:SAG11_NODE_877_length_6761_cov_5.177574_1_plen_137_part_10
MLTFYKDSGCSDDATLCYASFHTAFLPQPVTPPPRRTVCLPVRLPNRLRFVRLSAALLPTRPAARPPGRLPAAGSLTASRCRRQPQEGGGCSLLLPKRTVSKAHKDKACKRFGDHFALRLEFVAAAAAAAPPALRRD